MSGGADGQTVELSALRGRTLGGRYELGELLGEGGFGAVFRSDQRLLGAPVRRVAVKVSRRTGLTEQTVRELFGDALLLAEAMDDMTDLEARAHLVHLYDAGLADDLGGRGYLVMEYVQGTTLQAQFAQYRRGVPARLMTAWAKQIAVALRGLHSLVPPLLHRDLKPDNVLLGLDKRVRVVDFGLAARMLSAGHVEGVAGTVSYMAPETAQGASVRASDLYSLGLLVYQGLTGRHPFGHLHPPDGMPTALHSQWTYHARADCRVDPPSLLNNTVPAALDDLVLRCLAHDPQDRFRTADELLEAIGEYEAARTPLPPPPPTPAPSVPQELREHIEAAEKLAARGEHGTAARHRELAWRLVQDNPALVRSKAERAELLHQISASYRADGNVYQADRYADLARRERRPDR
ncbi:serine/threonine-protein kinase [Actinomadura hibisca]|uniref:serine/threonine-protein kinase n=1 Tax=Actinomadura hibisca TaxID=68565 RepID=UPI0008321223|nr:serine/threonine-protein kinase [Actinomadura hibisca]